MSTNNNVKSETNKEALPILENTQINDKDIDEKKGYLGEYIGDVVSDFADSDSILNFSIPQWDYISFADELNSFRKGLTGIASEPGWFYFKIFFHFDESFGLLGNVLVENPGNTAYDYLISRQNLFKYDNLKSRALALEKFVKYLSFINCNAPWFFDKIDGLDKAIVSLNEFNKEKQLSISCLEDAIDMRLTTLFHLYQYACFDEINMKEIIPENLRKFNMTVILYHVPIKYYSTQLPMIDAKSIHGNGTGFSNRMSYKMFTFKGCEFNLESLGTIVPSSADNAQPFNLAKSSIIINYDRVFTHLMNEWDQFMVGPDGIYFDKEHKIDDYDPSFKMRLLELLKTNDNPSYAVVDTLLSKPALTFIGRDVTLGNIYNINTAKFKSNIIQQNTNSNRYIGNLYGLSINKLKANIIEQNNPRNIYIDLGNVFGIDNVTFIKNQIIYYNKGIHSKSKINGGNKPLSTADFDIIRMSINNRQNIAKNIYSSNTDFYSNVSGLYSRLNDRIYNINKEYDGDMENLTSSISKNENSRLIKNIDNTNIEYYMLGIQSIDTQKSIWDNLVLSWESIKSSVKYTLKNSFKIRL